MPAGLASGGGGGHVVQAEVCYAQHPLRPLWRLTYSHDLSGTPALQKILETTSNESARTLQVAD